MNGLMGVNYGDVHFLSDGVNGHSCLKIQTIWHKYTLQLKIIHSVKCIIEQAAEKYITAKASKRRVSKEFPEDILRITKNEWESIEHVKFFFMVSWSPRSIICKKTIFAILVIDTAFLF